MKNLKIKRMINTIIIERQMTPGQQNDLTIARLPIWTYLKYGYQKQEKQETRQIYNVSQQVPYGGRWEREAGHASFPFDRASPIIGNANRLWVWGHGQAGSSLCSPSSVRLPKSVIRTSLFGQFPTHMHTCTHFLVFSSLPTSFTGLVSYLWAVDISWLSHKKIVKTCWVCVIAMEFTFCFCLILLTAPKS